MKNETFGGDQIAIVGMAGRFPMASNLEEYWKNLAAGVESVRFFNDAELEETLPAGDPRVVKARAVLDHAEWFDPEFFGMNPREAELTDPQHRLFLELAWEALEHAGCDPERFGGSIGVFAGSSMNTYYETRILRHPTLAQELGFHHRLVTNDKDFLPTRTSYKLNLKGPSLNIQTACSTSLVAVATACQNLLQFQCDAALAGAVSILFPQKHGYLHQEGGILSPDGHCRAFDAEARGTITGDGGGVVLLKRLEDAVENGDTIHAIIRGFAINNDGSAKVGFAAPSVEGQSEVIAMALAMAGVSPESISYVEGHGTGTALGDPIEVAALTRAYRLHTEKRVFCGLGSVKSNIGHLDVAAGMASLIKTVLALQHRKIPPTLHCSRPNPKMEFESTPFYVNNALRDWERRVEPRRAGVSSFGLGGTNAHVILEEGPEMPAGSTRRSIQLLTVSARSAKALDQSARNLARHLERHPEVSTAHAAFTTHAGRRAFPYRRAVPAGAREEAIAQLDSVKGHAIALESIPEQRYFVLSGQGAQRAAFGKGLYETEPVFRSSIDSCASAVSGRFDLKELLFSADPQAAGRLDETQFAQPALFAFQVALARLWMHWGVVPTGLVGHSLGEWIGAALAGVFSIEEGMRLVALRGELMQKMEPGAMLSVRLPEEAIRARLDASLELAAVNGEEDCVISGSVEAIDRFAAHLEKEKIGAKKLRTSHAFHSRMMEPMMEAMESALKQAKLSAPKIPLLSSLHGRWIRGEEATDARYWICQLRSPVRFHAGLSELFGRSQTVFIEMGPRAVLSPYVSRHPSNERPELVFQLSAREEEARDERALARCLGDAWCAGLVIDWNRYHEGEKVRRVPLPTYPFERRLCSVPAAGVFKLEIPVEVENGKTLRPAASISSANSSAELLESLKELISDLSGIPAAQMTPQSSYLQLGLDSLALTRVRSKLEERFHTRVGFRQLLDELPTLGATADHLFASQAKIPQSGGESPRTPASRTGSSVQFPLTDPQKELWFASQLGEEASSAFNESYVMELEGPLQVTSLTRAIRELVRRHDSLRMRFARDGVHQCPVESPRLELPIHDLSGLESQSAAERREEILQQESWRAFELDAEPPCRFRLIRLSPSRHQLVFTAHHIACDGRSFGLLFHELAEIYSAEASGIKPVLGEAPSYGQYARAISDRSQDPAADAFWLQQLADPPVAVRLPSDRPRAGRKSFTGGRLHGKFHRSQLDALKTFSRANQCTLFHVLLSAFAGLIHRLSGSRDFLVGVPTAARDLPGAESLVGHCIQFLPMRFRIPEEIHYEEFLGEVRRVFLNSYEHQNCTLGRLLQKLNLPRDAGSFPLISTTFNLGYDRGRLDFLGLQAGWRSNPHNRTAFEFSLNMVESPDELLWDCHFNRDLFHPETIAQWMELFRAGLDEMLAAPDRPLPRPSADPEPRAAMASPGEVRARSRPRPLSPVEEIVAGIWRELLETDAVESESNFFEQGGHSLLVMRLLLRIRELIEIEISLEEFFRAPTVGAVAALIEQKAAAQVGTAAGEAGTIHSLSRENA